MQRNIHKKTSLAILAGGKSRRFGKQKSDVDLRGKPLIRHVYDAARPVVDDVMVSLGAGGARPDLPDAILVHDIYRGSGPLAGIHACLQEASNSWMLVLACDLPCVRTETLERLILEATPGQQIIVSQAEGGQVQPLCGCYHRSLLKPLEKALFAGRFGVLRFIDSVMHVKRITVAPDELVNVNRPDDLEEISIP